MREISRRSRMLAAQRGEWRTRPRANLRQHPAVHGRRVTATTLILWFDCALRVLVFCAARIISSNAWRAAQLSVQRVPRPARSRYRRILRCWSASELGTSAQ